MREFAEKAIAESANVNSLNVKCVPSFCRVQMVKPAQSSVGWPEIDDAFTAIATGGGGPTPPLVAALGRRVTSARRAAVSPRAPVRPEHTVTREPNEHVAVSTRARHASQTASTQVNSPLPGQDLRAAVALRWARA